MTIRSDLRLAGLVLALIATPLTAAAVELAYMTLDGVTGSAGPPGPAGSTRILTFDVTGSSLSVSKELDSTSPAIQNLVFSGTVVDSLAVDVFAVDDAGTRRLQTLLFSDVIVSSYSVSGGGEATPVEDITFAFVAVEEIYATHLYMTLDGVTGSAAPPGPAGSIPILSFSISDSSLIVSRELDSSSAAIQNLVFSGTLLDSARINRFETDALGTRAVQALLFSDVIVSSYSVSGGGEATPVENMTLVFTTWQEVPALAVVPLGGPIVWLALVGLLTTLGLRAAATRRTGASTQGPAAEGRARRCRPPGTP